MNTYIDGRLVGHTRLERSFGGFNPPDQVFLFEGPKGWTVHRIIVRDNDATAETIADLATVDAVAQLIRYDYYRHGWIELLDATSDYDELHPDLVRHRAATRIERDFADSSLHSRDLALVVGADRSVIAGPGRLLSDWKHDAVSLMAAQLDSLGHQVLERTVDSADDIADTRDETIGTVTVACYGFQTTGLVRVDDAGEIFVRLPYGLNDHDLEHIDQLLTPYTDPDDDF